MGGQLLRLSKLEYWVASYRVDDSRIFTKLYDGFIPVTPLALPGFRLGSG